MRLTLSALFCAALISGPALAHDHHGDATMPPPPGMNAPPPPGFDGSDEGDRFEGGYQGGYGAGPGAPVDPRWAHDQDRMRHEWQMRCGRHHGPTSGDCRYPGGPAPYGYGYPGAYMGYAVPMIMVPVLRSKPCPQVVEEWVDEEVPVRRRLIRPRVRVAPMVHDKRIRIDDKRVRIAPTKRIAY